MAEPNDSNQFERKSPLEQPRFLEETAPPEDGSVSLEKQPAQPGSSDLPTDVTTDFGDGSGASVSTNSSSLPFKNETPTKLIGGYRLSDKLGEGGMGRVYRALDGEGRAVAIKLLSPRWATSPDALLRFKQEGVIASQINHPHCVFVHRVDEEQGTPYIAMELMSGRTLKDLVAKRGPLPAEEAVQLILQCIDGLIATHAQGMIHRDIKPANCYLDDQGVVKIGDFGLARSLVDDSELTRTGAFLGTPLFASPEQVLGQPIDKRSDIYSLSATLYFLLAGKAPFESPNAAQVIAKIASSDPPLFREMEVDVPKGLENIVLRGLARDRNKRFASFEQMREELLPIIEPQEGVGSIARRAAASIIDTTLLAFATGFSLLFFYSPREMRDLNPLVPNLLGALIAFLYYWIQESLFATTIGKRLFRLKVVNRETGGRQQPKWLSLRTASFIFFLALTENLIHLSMGKLSTFVLPLIGWFSSLVGFAILFTTWWKTGKRQLIHEWLSGTETRLSSYARKTVPIHLELPNWSPRLVDKPKSNSDFGRFESMNQLQTIDQSRWFLAKDSTLEREVWIQLQGGSVAPMTEERRNCVRLTRMRLIESGNSGNERWDAYLAPQGVPLSESLKQGQTLPWPIARRVFHQLMKEYQVQGGDRVSENQWSLSRIWIDESGRITFSEAPLLPEVTQESPSFEHLLTQVAHVSLPHTHRSRRELFRVKRSNFKSVRVSELAPYRGLKLIEKIINQPPGNRFDAEKLDSELRLVDEAPTVVSASTRFAHAAAHSLLMLPLLVFGFVFLSIGSIITTLSYQEETRDLATLSAVLHQPEQYKNWLKDLEEDQREKWFNEASKDRVDRSLQESFRRVQTAYSNVGTLGHMVLQQTRKGIDSYEEIPKPIDLRDPEFKVNEQSETSQKQEASIQVMGRRGVNIEFNSDPSSKTTFDQLVRVLDRLESGNPLPETSESFPSIELIGYPILALVLWATVFRGGLIQLFSGVNVIRRDGCRIGFLRSFWRASLLFLPFLILAVLIQWLEFQGADFFWYSNQLKRLFLILPLGYLVATLIWPQVCPHDKLSYTAMVPR